MCSRGVYLPTTPDELGVVNAPNFLRVNSFVDDDKGPEGKIFNFYDQLILFNIRHLKINTLFIFLL